MDTQAVTTEGAAKVKQPKKISRLEAANKIFNVVKHLDREDRIASLKFALESAERDQGGGTIATTNEPVAAVN